MDGLVRDETTVDMQKRKTKQEKAHIKCKNDDLALEPPEYEQEDMDCDEELGIMEASVPDFLHWSQMARWTLDQGIALLLDKDPYEVYWKRVRGYVNHYYSIPLCQDYAKLRTIVVQAKTINEITNEISPPAFLEWADKKCLAIPEMLKQQVEKIKARVNIKSRAAEADEERFELMKKNLEASLDYLKEKDIKIRFFSRICGPMEAQPALQAGDIKLFSGILDF